MNEKNTKLETAKKIIRFVVGGLVEIFIGAVTNSVVNRVDGSRAAKFGAKAGGFIVGMMVADQASDYVCSCIDDTMEELEKIKTAIDEQEE